MRCSLFFGLIAFGAAAQFAIAAADAKDRQQNPGLSDVTHTADVTWRGVLYNNTPSTVLKVSLVARGGQAAGVPNDERGP